MNDLIITPNGSGRIAIIRANPTRELRNENGRNLQASFVHAAEPHSLKALLQELIPPLKDTGAPDANGIEIAAGHGPSKRFPALALSAIGAILAAGKGEQHKSRPARRRSSARARGEHWACFLCPLPERELRGQRKSERDEEHRAGGDEAQLGRIPRRIGLRLERQ